MQQGPSYSENHYQALALLKKLQNSNLEDELNYEALFESYQIKKFSLEELCLKIEEGPKQGSNLIWFIAIAALAGYPEYLEHFWKKFGHEITSKELRVLGIQGISVLWILTRIAFLDSKTNIFKELLEKRSDIFTPSDLETKPVDYPNLKDLFEAATQSDVDILLKAKKAFHELIQKADEGSQSVVDSFIFDLEREAKLAYDAGYRSSYYDLGNFALENNLLSNALTYFDKVPKSSHDFSDANHKIGIIYYTMALEQRSVHQRNVLLQKACKHALLAPNDHRRQLLHLIGYCFVTQGKEKGLDDLKVIPEAWLDAMHELSPPEWCWERFIEIHDNLRDQKMKEERIVELEKLNQHLVKVNHHLEEENRNLRMQAAQNYNMNRKLEEINKKFEALTVSAVPTKSEKKVCGPTLTLSYQHSKKNHGRSFSLSVVSTCVKSKNLHHSTG